jgi:hypothetical protein
MYHLCSGFIFAGGGDRVYHLCSRRVFAGGVYRMYHLSGRLIFAGGGERLYHLFTGFIFTGGGDRMHRMSAWDVLDRDSSEQREYVCAMPRRRVFGGLRRERLRVMPDRVELFHTRIHVGHELRV